jgi:hypothetical protein
VRLLLIRRGIIRRGITIANRHGPAPSTRFEESHGVLKIKFRVLEIISHRRVGAAWRGSGFHYGRIDKIRAGQFYARQLIRRVECKNDGPRSAARVMATVS